MPTQAPQSPSERLCLKVWASVLLLLLVASRVLESPFLALLVAGSGVCLLLVAGTEWERQ